MQPTPAPSCTEDGQEMLPGSILGATRAQLPELRSVKSTLASQHLLCSSSVSGFLLFCLPVSRRRAEQELKAGGGQGLAGPGALGRSSIVEPGAAASLQSDEICADSFWQVTRRCCTQSQVKMGLACPFAVGFVLQTSEQIRVLLCA